MVMLNNKITFAQKVGKLVYVLGLLGLPLGIGMMIGYYISDRGVRWMPDMLRIFLTCAIISLFAIITGRIVSGKSLKITPDGLKIRRRVIFCLILMMLVLAGRLAVHYSQKPNALTRMSVKEFDRTFLLNTQLYNQYSKALDGQFEILSDQKELFEPEHALTPSEEKMLRESWVNIYTNAFAMDQIRLFYEDWYGFDPSRVQRELFLKSFMMTYAAELTLYEKSTQFTELITRNPNAEKFLNTPHLESMLTENSFSSFRDQLQGSRDLARVVAGKHYLNSLETLFEVREHSRVEGYFWLWQEARSRLGVIESMGNIDIASSTISSDLEVLKRSAKRVWFPTQKGVAQ